jgi:hypothetical protein
MMGILVGGNKWFSPLHTARRDGRERQCWGIEF